MRIFTTAGELPFAGHPTLGSAHAWLEAGGVPRDRTPDGVVVQECGAGLVRVRRGERLAFAAPPLVRSGPVADVDLLPALTALGLARDEVVDAAWIDNGPGWMGLLLRDAATVLRLRPSPAEHLEVGVLGRYPDVERAAVGADVEVRAFISEQGVAEDPVTGSLNAGFGQWLGGTVLPTSYVASQGTALQRRGRVHVTRADDGQVWVGGDARTVVVGEVDL